MEKENKQPGTGADVYTTEEIKDLLNIRKDLEGIKGRATPPDLAEMAIYTRRLSEAAHNVGGYYLAVPADIMERGQKYFREHITAIVEALNQAGADAETIDAVTFDYGGTLILGAQNYRATPQQMQTVLKAIPPLSGYYIDKYGLFLGLLWSYERILNKIGEYQTRVKNEPDAGKRNAYFLEQSKREPFNDLWAAASFWLLSSGIITTSDFAGVPQETIAAYLNGLYLYGQNGQFVLYFYIARYALNATPEQLEQLPAPPLYDKSEMQPIQAALSYAEAFAVYITEYLGKVGKQVGAVLSAPTPEELTRAQRKAQETASNFIIKLPPNFPALMSRQLWAANTEELHGIKDGDKIGNDINAILPIRRVIKGYLETHPNEAANVTPLLLQKSIEGVNLLYQLKRPACINDLYTLKTNLTEFSELCGYEDANEEEKKLLLTALGVLDRVFLIIWKPTGKVAQRLFTLESYGMSDLETGRLTIHVYAKAVRGFPKLVTWGEIMAMKQTEKGEAKRHFRGQILDKGHKEENALIDEIFSYSDKLREAEQTGDAGQVEAVKEYKRKKWSRDKKKLRRWFEDYAERGIISYTYYQSKTGVWVYSWERLKAPTYEEKNELRPTITALMKTKEPEQVEQPGGPDEQ